MRFQRIQNLSIPTWAQELLSSKEKMDQVYWIFTSFTLTDEMKRLAAGPILSELTKNMRKKVNGTESRKLFYYSGHDIILGNILNTLGLFKLHWPTFSSCLIFELYLRNSSQDYVLKVSSYLSFVQKCSLFIHFHYELRDFL
jgi:hypothetical protein